MATAKTGIYQLLEDALRKAGDDPQTCTDLYERPEIRPLVRDANRVSDYLGHMWRRGLLQRWYAPKDLSQRNRYAYTWKKSNDEPTPVIEKRIKRLRVIDNADSQPQAQTGIHVEETEGGVTIYLNDFIVTVKKKN